MKPSRFFDFSQLTPSGRIELAAELWDSVAPAASVDVLPLTVEQQTELEERLADYQRNPSASSSWDDARARIQDRLERERQQKHGA